MRLDLYPLKFETIYKEKIWGGTKLKDILKKDFSPLNSCGEAWEISGIKGSLSAVKEGGLKGWTLPELLAEYQDQLVGAKVYEKFGTEFPLLIKFVDATQDLSIQVHPDDHYAKAKHNQLGKSEMWYVLQADPGSQLISGFNKPTNKEEFQKHIEDGKITDLLNFENVKADDCFFMPAKRIHTIGKGLLLAEIQQASDITYRIFDFDRLDKKGKKRTLQIEEALDTLDYSSEEDYKCGYKTRPNSVAPLVKSKYFQTNLLDFTEDTERDHTGRDSFIIYTCIKGEGEIIVEGQSTNICMGHAVLVPRKFSQLDIKTKSGFKMLETFMP